MRILIISPYFPPRGCARSLQIGKVVKAINQCGLETFVIAGELNIDDNKRIDFEQVFHVPHQIRPESNNFVKKIYTKLMMELYSCNPISTFVKRAVGKSLEIIDHKKPDCILTSSTPFESHLIGLSIAKKTSIPWVASFSDPWPLSINPYPYNKSKIPFLSMLQEYYLRLVLKKCQAVHMPNKYAVDLMEKSTGIHITAKAHVIPHIGNTQTKDDIMEGYHGWIAHIGKLTRERVSLPLLLAVSRTHKEMPEQFKGLLCVGEVCSEFKNLVKDLKIEHCVNIVGHLPQKKALQIAKGAGALLVLEAEMKASPYLPSKFVDYVLTGKPIIAVTPTISAIRDYLVNYSKGTPVLHNEKSIADAIKSQWKATFKEETIKKNDAMDKDIHDEFTNASVGLKYKKMFKAVSTVANLNII